MPLLPRIPPVQAKSHEGKSSQAEFKDDPNFAIVRQESIGYTLHELCGYTWDHMYI